MLKKILILLILVIIVVVYSSNKAAQQGTEGVDDWFQIEDFVQSECKGLEVVINSAIDETRTCNSSSDCFVDESTYLGCPFGCRLIRNNGYKNEEQISLIKEQIKQYNEKCSLCKYKCDVAPVPEDIECVNNKCVDNRYSIKDDLN